VVTDTILLQANVLSVPQLQTASPVIQSTQQLVGSAKMVISLIQTEYVQNVRLVVLVAQVYLTALELILVFILPQALMAISMVE